MYNYEEMKPYIFHEENQEDFLKVRDNVFKLLKQSGSFTMGKAIGIITGDSWIAMAYVDRMVELGEIYEVTNPNDVCGQNRIFTAF